MKNNRYEYKHVINLNNFKFNKFNRVSGGNRIYNPHAISLTHYRLDYQGTLEHSVVLVACH